MLFPYISHKSDTLHAECRHRNIYRGWKSMNRALVVLQTVMLCWQRLEITQKNISGFEDSLAPSQVISQHLSGGWSLLRRFCIVFMSEIGKSLTMLIKARAMDMALRKHFQDQVYWWFQWDTQIKGTGFLGFGECYINLFLKFSIKYET